MAFHAFKLTQLRVNRPRGRIPDNDIVTFSVFVNQKERGGGAGLFPALSFGSVVPAAAVTANTHRGAMTSDWIVGPLELAAGDVVNVVYSGTNVSDSELDPTKQAQIEIKILDTILTGAVGAIGGLVGSAIGAALGFIGDPVGTILGFHPQGPCNGLVFSDTLTFSGDELNRLSYGPPQIIEGFLATLPDAKEASFTKSYTDEATHDKSACGDFALTDVTMSVLRVPSVSVRSQNQRFFKKDLSLGLRQLAQDPNSTLNLKTLLRVTP
jgi:hypothetical protein